MFAATGQTCMAGSRLIVHESVKDKLIAKVATRANAIKQGDPTRGRDRDGPGGQPSAVRKVLGFLAGAKEEGATIACGGAPNADLGGLFIKPTVVVADPTKTIVRQEVFGPVFGRENGTDAVYEYLETKSVLVELTGGTRARLG